MAEPLIPIYTSPRTESHLRKVLNDLVRNAASIIVDIEDLENAIIRTGTASGSALTARDIVYVSSANNYTRAIATSVTTADAVGVVIADADMGADVQVLVAGSIQSTGWGLTASGVYYLSPTVAGSITTTRPTTVGQVVIQVGKALSTDILALGVQEMILL